MQVKNVSNRGWNVGGITIAPGKTEEVECNEADIKDNADLEIVKGKPGRPAGKVEAE